MSTWKAAQVFVANAQSEWHVIEGGIGRSTFGGKTIAVCKDEETALLIASTKDLLTIAMHLIDFANKNNSINLSGSLKKAVAAARALEKDLEKSIFL